MEHHHFHGLEKLQVQIMTVAGLLAVYFLAWPVVRPDDPLSPMTFLPLGGYGSAVAFAGMFCVLVALCAVVTVAVRPVGALLAATLSAGAISLRSPQIRGLLWTRTADLDGVYCELMLEAVMLAMLAAAGSLIVYLVRRLVRSVRPQWLWTDPMAELTDEQRANVTDAPSDAKGGIVAMLFGQAVHSMLVSLGKEGSRIAGRRDPLRIVLARCAACIAMASVIAVVILTVVLRSADRGQIIFALVASFTAGVFFAHQAFPQPYALVVWILPMVISVGFYATAWLVATPGQATDWSKVNVLFRALPVDWLTAGGGGALLGFWASHRVHEFRHVHGHHEHE